MYFMSKPRSVRAEWLAMSSDSMLSCARYISRGHGAGGLVLVCVCIYFMSKLRSGVCSRILGFYIVIRVLSGQGTGGRGQGTGDDGVDLIVQIHFMLKPLWRARSG